MNELAKFLGAMFTLSIGVERVVEVIKGALNSKNYLVKPHPHAHTPGRDAGIQLIAALVGTLIVTLVGAEKFLPTDVHLDRGGLIAVTILLGAMSSGGSAFWNQTLSIVAAARAQREVVLQGLGGVLPSPTPAPADPHQDTSKRV
ncbi:MAG: hypothetical protein U0228_32150 [Myxococcaceae bacterium]